jgi:hypothetical protein
MQTFESTLLGIEIDYPEGWAVSQPAGDTVLVTDEPVCSLTIFPADGSTAITMGVRYRDGMDGETLLSQFNIAPLNLEEDDAIDGQAGEVLTAYRPETAQTGRYLGVLVLPDRALIFLSAIDREYDLKDNCVASYRAIMGSVRETE